MSLALRVLVCDDESMARKRLFRLLGDVPGIDCVTECASGEGALASLANDDVDVVLMDIQMPGIGGLDTVLKMTEDRPYVIFVTAHPEHAVKAFDVGADDYILKPIDAARLAVAFERARSSLAQERLPKRDAPKFEANTKLAIQTHDGVVLVRPSDITHATFDGTLVNVHTAVATFLADCSMQELEERLPATFERVHRRTLVNMDHVERLESTDTGGYRAHLASGVHVEVSRQSARRLRRTLGLR